jgi:hypothetical protein
MLKLCNMLSTLKEKVIGESIGIQKNGKTIKLTAIYLKFMIITLILENGFMIIKLI